MQGGPRVAGMPGPQASDSDVYRGGNNQNAYGNQQGQFQTPHLPPPSPAWGPPGPPGDHRFHSYFANQPRQDRGLPDYYSPYAHANPYASLYN